MKGFLLTYLLALTGGAFALRYPHIGLFIYVGFAILRPQFLWGWAGDLGGVSDIVAIPMILGWALNGFGSWRFGRGRGTVAALVMFTAWASLSALQAKHPDVSWAWIVELGKTVVPFVIGVTILDSEKRARQLVWIIVLAEAYVSLELNLEYLNGFNRAANFGFGGMDNNSLGINLVTILGLALGMAMWTTTWTQRALAGIATLLILHATLLTFSRGAFIGLLALGLTAVIILPKRPKHMAGLVVVGLIALRLTGPQLAARYQTTFADEESRDPSAASRLELWGDCLTVIGAYPLLGVGPKNFPLIADEFGWPPGKEAHSVWMQTTAEVGLPGGVALLMFYLLTAGRLWHIARLKATENRLAAGVASGLIMSTAAYVASAQFVSLVGLETPFYVMMAAVVLLRAHSVAPILSSDTGESLSRVRRSAGALVPPQLTPVAVHSARN